MQEQIKGAGDVKKQELLTTINILSKYLKALHSVQVPQKI